ncbi:hypothetical protein HWV62_16562 [Athelia sp. TMB]|nr:hypothetical protein HWV62_16562 [Athelia sp. TMB]
MRALAATDCYVSCMRIMEAACSMPRDEVARWPYSIAFGYPIACISLIRLLSTEDGRALDMNAALTQISAVFRVASELSVNEDSLRRRFNQLVSFSGQDAQARRLQLGENNPASDGPSKIFSRMGLSNWLHDSIARAKQIRPLHEDPHHKKGGEILGYAAGSLFVLIHKQKMTDSCADDTQEGDTQLIAESSVFDYSMFTTSDFDDILASFSQGEWSVPASFFAAG